MDAWTNALNSTRQLPCGLSQTKASNSSIELQARNPTRLKNLLLNLLLTSGAQCYLMARTPVQHKLLEGMPERSKISSLGSKD